MDETAEDLSATFGTLVESEGIAAALEYLSTIHPADAADLLESLEDERLAELLERWSAEQAAAVLTELEPERVDAIAERVKPELLARFLDAMPPDDAARFLEETDPERGARILARMERQEASDVAELLDFPEDSAGRRMSQDFVSVGEEATADDVIEQLRGVPQDVELIYYVYVLGGSEQLKGVVSLRKLIMAEPRERVGNLMETDLVSARPTDDIESVVDLVRRYNLIALPVTDELGRMLGIVTIDDVLETMEEEAEEDVLRFAGSIEEQDPGTGRPWPAVRRRLPWLAAATVIEVLLAQALLRPLPADLLVVAVAFVPLLIFVGGNTAVHAAARVLVRLESERTEAWTPWRQARREVKGGLVMAVIASVASFPFLVLLGGGWEFATVVAPAVSVSVLAGATIGAGLPIVLHRLRVDPAIASGPLLGSVMDVISLLVYVRLLVTFSASVL